MPDFQNFSTIQDVPQPFPAVVSADSVITPSGFLTMVTGDPSVIETINPPSSNSSLLAFVFDTGGILLSSGNIAQTYTIVAEQLVMAVYEPITAKWYFDASIDPGV